MTARHARGGPMPRSALRLTPLQPLPDARAVRRVLVVDDSRVQRRILMSYLNRLGFAAIEAASGAEALEIARRMPVDLVISDWMMPGMDGLAFCRALRAEQTEGYVYFILLTSKSEKGEMAQGLDVGADDFLAKPVGLDELRARIVAGERILSMERELQHRNRVANAALTELRLLYDALDRDLVEARKLQQSLVRDSHAVLPQGAVNLLLKPAGHVGGDLVGFFRAGDEALCLYSLDVSGHGIASAMLTARLAAFLSGSQPEHNVALDHDSRGRVIARAPVEVAERLNRLMLDEVETGLYFTMILAVVHLRSGRVRMVQAGHPPPMVQAADGAVRLLGNGGMPIGLLETPVFGEIEVTLAPGDRLLVCSDGFSECPDATGAMLGEDGLRTWVEGGRTQRGAALLDTLVWDLARHADDADFPDDLSAMLFEYSGPEPL